jgi:flagellar basal body-associated protein FliL
LIIGIVSAIVVSLIGVGGILFFCIRRRRRKQEKSVSEKSPLIQEAKPKEENRCVVCMENSKTYAFPCGKLQLDRF